MQSFIKIGLLQSAKQEWIVTGRKQKQQFNCYILDDQY